MILPVNEVFETIQGEGSFTGTPAVFVRLQGCPVGCPWCDTKHTWFVEAEDEIAAGEMMAKEADAKSYANFYAGTLASRIAQDFRARHIVITGGEPALYDLKPLCEALARSGKGVQIETSGTQPVRCGDQAFVTLSPKIGMPGGFPIIQESVDRANEIKMPVGSPRDVERLKEFLEVFKVRTSEVPVYLQPLSQSEKATALCIEAATVNGWKLSAQLHKFIGVR